MYFSGRCASETRVQVSGVWCMQSELLSAGRCRDCLSLHRGLGVGAPTADCILAKHAPKKSRCFFRTTHNVVERQPPFCQSTLVCFGCVLTFETSRIGRLLSVIVKAIGLTYIR